VPIGAEKMLEGVSIGFVALDMSVLRGVGEIVSLRSG